MIADAQRAGWLGVVRAVTGMSKAETDQLAEHLDALATELRDVFFEALADVARASAAKTDEPAATEPDRRWN